MLRAELVLRNVKKGDKLNPIALRTIVYDLWISNTKQQWKNTRQKHPTTAGRERFR